jgi:hypothetical protein
MEDVFNNLLVHLEVTIAKTKMQLDNSMKKAENTLEKSELDKLRNTYDKLDEAIKNKDLEALNHILKNAN